MLFQFLLFLFINNEKLLRVNNSCSCSQLLFVSSARVHWGMVPVWGLLLSCCLVAKQDEWVWSSAGHIMCEILAASCSSHYLIILLESGAEDAVLQGVLMTRKSNWLAWVNILPRNFYNAISTFFENLIFLTTPAPLFSGKCNKKPNTRPFFERF